jgi:glyoxylase-like metal-dependent hydrolase (beta-lactamase superfamily II)
MKIHFFAAGYCSADNSHSYINAPKGKTEFPAFWALLQHPTLGNFVFDTGYAQRFLDATRSFPNMLYRLIVPVTFKEGDDVKSQLKSNFGIDNQDIKYVIISHFHGDHVGGLIDFPNAKIICTRAAFEHIWQHNDFFAFTKAYLKNLLPEDLPSRCLFIEENFQSIENQYFTKVWHWAEADLTFIDLPGHARGQVGVLLQSEGGSEEGAVFLAADAAWHINSVEKNVPPPSLVRVFADDYEALKDSIARLHRYHLAYPMTKIIISHCKQSLKKYFTIA